MGRYKNCFFLLLICTFCLLIASFSKAQQVTKVSEMPLNMAKFEATISILKNPFTVTSPQLNQLIDAEIDYTKTAIPLKTQLFLACSNYYLIRGDRTQAILFLKQAENLLPKSKLNERNVFLIEIARLNAKLGNFNETKNNLANLESKTRGQISPYLSINNLLLQANVFVLLKDNKNKNRVLADADLLASDLSVNIDESETSHILCQLIINSIRLGRYSNLNQYYKQLLLKEKNTNDFEYIQAIAMYQDYKKQYVTAEHSYKKLTKIYLKGNKTEYGFEALVRLANLYSKQLNSDSAQRYFSLAKNDINPAIANQALGALYSKLYHEHLLRFNQNKTLITSVSKTLKQRDSTYKQELEATLKEANYKYSIITNRQKIKLLTQQKELSDLNIFKVKQRNWLITLSLILLVLGAFTLSYVFYQKRKRSLMQFLADKERTEHEHHLQMNKMLATSQEEERTRIAEKLHDEIGSMLAVVRFNLSTPNNDDTVVLPNGQLKTASKVLGDVADTVREMSHELMPIALNKLGLKKAIEQLIWDINASGKINIESVIMGMEKEENNFTYDFEVNIYRIIQELFQNILKHAKATHVLFQLLIRANELNIMIEDNGVGIIQNKDYNGKGMKLIDARLNNYKGKMTIDSQKGNGTLVIIDIPMESIRVE